MTTHSSQGSNGCRGKRNEADTAASTNRAKSCRRTESIDSAKTLADFTDNMDGRVRQARSSRCRKRRRQDGFCKIETGQDRSKRSRIPGFSNNGNLCYLNTVMQVLLANNAFVDELLRLDERGGRDADMRPVTTQLIKMVKERRGMQAQPVIPRSELPSVQDLKDALTAHIPAFFGNDNQQDAHEAFINIIICIEKENAGTYDCPFSYSVLQTTTCTNCRHESIAEEEHLNAIMSLRDPEGPSLEGIIGETSGETLSCDCLRCKAKAVDHKRTRKIMTLPKTLVVQLGRVDDRMCKIDDMVTPEDTPELKLAAVVHHSGTGSRGHYYAAVRTGDDWTMTDDSRTRAMKQGKAYKPSATSCVYFYERM